MKPILLCADSQLLFWQTDGVPFLQSARALIEHASPRAAYVGASNDDRPEFYTIFLAAMESVGITDCRMIPSALSAEDEAFVREADLILLAGGDALKGWRTFEKNGLRELIPERYLAGAVLVGVSAGAMQLGLYAWSEDESEGGELAGTFGLLPYVIGAHEEKDGWRRLRAALPRTRISLAALGIPAGGGAIFHADHSVEPVRKSLQEFRLENDQLEVNVLYPPGDNAQVVDDADPSDSRLPVFDPNDPPRARQALGAPTTPS